MAEETQRMTEEARAQLADRVAPGQPGDHSGLVEMWENAIIASSYLKALANESRLLVLCLLAEKERSVGELEMILEMRQPTVSQQLARLRMEGLVSTRRDGKTIYYSLADEKTRRFIGLIYETFCHR